MEATFNKSDGAAGKQLDRQTLTTTEAARVIGVVPETIRRLAHRGVLKPIPGLRRKLFSQVEITRFINGGAA